MFFPVFIGNYLDYILDIVNNKLYKLWIFLYFLKSIFFLSSFFFFFRLIVYSAELKCLLK